MEKEHITSGLTKLKKTICLVAGKAASSYVQCGVDFGVEECNLAIKNIRKVSYRWIIRYDLASNAG